ncbi:MAG TPA: hypothetical protein VGR28_13045 [Candidatus Thermoplasmatota archaeon]|jgi:hypothetical protein|nr:hypothetical protein [Candidatus Thermoplasmatota archaeon]
MNGKIARLQDLLAAGWDVEDIVSDVDQIDVLLARGAARMVVGLDRQDAWDVMYGDAFELPAKSAREEPMLH